MNSPVLGIDVSKAILDCFLLHDNNGVHREVENDSNGLRKLAAWLRKSKAQNALICLEATGALWEDAAHFLHQRGWKVAVVNPRFIKHFAIGAHARTKTDRYDSQIIAEYGQRMPVTLWTPPLPEVAELRQCVRELQDLIQTRAREKNRLSSRELVQVVINSIRAHIAHLDLSIADLETHIQQLIENHQHLKRDVDLLQTIPGVGTATAWHWVAELGDCSQFADARQLAAFLGLTPMQRQSGSSLNAPSRLCKMGNRRLRKTLYFPAIAAKRHNPAIRIFADRLARNGKPPKSIIGACMRKLAHLMFAVIRSQTPFDSNRCSTNH